MSRIRDVLDRSTRRSRPRRKDAEDSPPRRRRRRWWLYLVVLLLVVLGLAPQIASVPPLRDILLQTAARDIDGTVTADSLALGWFSGVRIHGLKLMDAAGEPIAHLAELRVERGLLPLLFGKDLGVVTLSKPHLNWVAEPGGSNLELALAKLLQQPAPSEPTRLPAVHLRVVDGTVQLSRRGDSEFYYLDGIQGDVAVAPPLGKLEFDLQTAPRNQAGAVGELKIKGNAALVEGASLGPGNLDLIARAVPAEVVRPLLHRIGESASSSGTLGTEMHLAWTESLANLWNGEIEAQFNQVSAEQWTLTTERWLQNDRLAVARFQATGKILQRGGITLAQHVRGESEFAQVEVNGQFDWSALAGAIAGGQLPDDDFSVSGQVDLAQVIRMFPHTLPLHADLDLRRAELTFTSFNRMEGSTRRWLIDAEAKNIEAHQAGRPIQWNRPARLTAAWVQDGPRPRLESLRAETSSVSLTGGSDLQSGQVRATGDLAALLAELRQIAPLEGYELAGQFQGELTWSTRAIDQIAATSWPIQIGGAMHCQQLVVRLPGYERFVEPQADLTWRAEGIASRNGIDQVASGSLDFVAGADRLSAQVSEPIERPSLTSRWPAQVELSGGTATWLARLGPLLPPLDVQTSGQLWVQTPLVVSGTTVLCSPLKLELKDWTFDGWGLHLREPQITGSGDLALDGADQRLTSREFTLTSASLALRAVDSQVTAQSETWQVATAASYRADVNRVQRWFYSQFDETAPQWFGECEGTVRLLPTANTIRGEIDLNLKNLTAAKYTPAAPAPAVANTAANPWTILWQEPVARVQTTLAVDSNFQAVQIERAIVQSQLVSLEARGSVSDLANRNVADLTGVWLPNWDAAAALIRAYAGNQVELTGSQQPQQFAVRGPLTAQGSAWVSPELTAEVSVAWEGGRMYGLPLGGAQLTGTLNQSVFQVTPARIPLSQGTIHVSPSIDLRSDPTLLVGAGTVLESIALTPEICHDWMKYIAPVLAESTHAQGKFSLATDGVQMPLLAPQRGSARGRLIIESASVLPGPLGQQLIALANSVKQMAEGQPLTALLQPPNGTPTNSSNGLLEVPTQEIGWELRDGQVFHDGLTLNVRGIPIKTSGGIGLDSKLNLLAEVPIQDSWIQKHPFLASLRGKNLRLPIVGTRTQPRIDPTAWTQFLRQWAGGAASAELNNQLNDFFNQQLGGKIPGLNASAAQPPATPNANPNPPLGDALQQAAESQLQDGLNKLFGPKKK